ncbi:hypothetical protein HDE68_002193 [Pedobacter cryoconitis]|uniref:Uncharacterized protein n=1 Tax=Pedobacter cryoconitis TaxID=188932 RepID=A0A7W8ZLW8_9SPHI|nr:hypothetical protein [Pedobacter cryoconitis]MBB5636305.1 hypothetical protein [Pedobacter cryoconitis]
MGSSSPVIFGSVGVAYPTWGVSMNHIVEDVGENKYGMALLTQDSYLTGRTEKMRITSEGNVGIGTITPNSKLQVAGTISTINIANTVGSSVPVIYGSIGAAYSTWGVSMNHVVEDAGANHYGMALLTTDSFLTGRTEKMRIASNGNVGIGTTNPDEKLAVNGTIHSKEVRVDSNNWPDYVFHPQYNLPALGEVKAYIEKSKHLPEMPSAAQVEAKGLNLGEMNTLLTKKVEELTLYLLDKEDEVKMLRSNVKSLVKNYKDQEEELKAVRNILNKLKITAQ